MKKKLPQTKRHAICIERLTNEIAAEKNEEKKSAMTKDLSYLKNMNPKTFINLFDTEFVGATFEHKRSLAICLKLVQKSKDREEQYKRSLTSVVVRTIKCAHCGRPHTELNVRFDQDFEKINFPFTVCPISNLRLAVVLEPPKNKMTLTNLRDILYHTDFEVVRGDAQDVERIKFLNSHEASIY